MSSSEIKEFKISGLCHGSDLRCIYKIQVYKSIQFHYLLSFCLLFSCSFCYGHISDQILKPDDITCIYDFNEHLSVIKYVNVYCTL